MNIIHVGLLQLWKDRETIKVVWHKAASLPHTDGSIVFARWRQCATHLLHPNRYPHRTNVLPLCWVPLSISTTGHVWACPVPVPFGSQNCPFTHGALDFLQYAVPWANPSPYPKWHLDRFSCFCTAHGRESLYFTTGSLFSPSKLPIHIGNLDLQSSI